MSTTPETLFDTVPAAIVGGALHFEDIETGDVWLSPPRVITKADVECFAQLTGDDNPLHLDAEFASTTPFGQPIAHGLLGLSLVSGLSSRHPQMQPAIFTKIENWRFLRPIYIGDSVSVRTEVVDKRPAGRRRGTVIWKRQLVNQDELVVQEGTAETLIPLSRRPLPR